MLQIRSALLTLLVLLSFGIFATAFSPSFLMPRTGVSNSLVTSSADTMRQPLKSGSAVKVEEMKKVSIAALLQSDALHKVVSCDVEMDAGKDLVVFNYNKNGKNEGLLAQLQKVQPGDLIIISKRLALVEGKMIKLHGLYYVVK